MAHKYDGDSDYDLFEDFEDLPSEHESDMSADEFDDQGEDDYGHYSDYIDIEEEPLHARASRNVQSRTAGSSTEPQPGPSTAPQPGDAQVDDQVDDQHNIAHIGEDLQFEDASSSPEKQPTPQRSGFSLRSLRQGAAKRSYQECDDPDSPDSPPPQRRPAGRGFGLRLLASLDLDAPSSPGSDADFVPESAPRREGGVGRPPSRPRGRGRGRGCGRGVPAQDAPDQGPDAPDVPDAPAAAVVPT